jgi:hypothetical protein
MPITDMFLERMHLSQKMWKIFLAVRIHELFWLRLNGCEGCESLGKELARFILANSHDMNRLFIENMSVSEDFLCVFINENYYNAK